MSEFRPVLLVIDVQRGFITAGSEHVVAPIADLVARWQQAGQPVIFTRFANYEGSPYERLIGWYGLQEPPETDLVDDLAPLAEHDRTVVVDKTVYSALGAMSAELLDMLGYTDLFICGIDTDGCVLKTALDAFEADYTPWVLADACASSTKQADPAETHRGALALLARLIGAGQIINAADALAMLSPEHAALLAAK